MSEVKKNTLDYAPAELQVFPLWAEFSVIAIIVAVGVTALWVLAQRVTS